MNAFYRPLLVLLLLLAVPFQGFAAAGMLLCAPGAPLHAAQAPAPAATAMECHDHAAMVHAGGHDGHDGHDSQHGNGSCASCCLGAAMAPAAQPQLAPARPEFVSIPFRPGHVPSVDPALPERPPRHLLA